MVDYLIVRELIASFDTPFRDDSDGLHAHPVKMLVLVFCHLDPFSLFKVIYQHKLLDINVPLHFSCHNPDVRLFSCQVHLWAQRAELRGAARSSAELRGRAAPHRPLAPAAFSPTLALAGGCCQLPLT